MMNMKRMLSLILAFVMVLGMFPVPAFATEGEEDTSVGVVLSLSADDRFMVGPGSDAIMALKEITVPYFDLALYGLEEYYFVSESYSDDGDGKPGSDLQPGTAEYAEGKVTLLHLYIYALEVFYCGIDPDEAGQGYLYEEGLIGTEVFSISGGVGSSFMNQFWGGDCNLNYYVNYEYPLASDGWGATSDQILLRDGDIITLGHFTGWSFYADPYSIFNYITADNENPVRGEEITLTLYYAGADLGATGGTAQNLNTHCLDVYCAPADDIPSEDVTDWQFVGTADENGELVVDTAALEAGEYIFAVAGQPGDYTEEICSTPGGVRITVEEPAHTHSYEAAVTDPTCTEGGYTTYTCACGDSYTADETEALGHDFVEGTCTRCGEKDPDYVAPVEPVDPVTATVYFSVTKHWNIVEAEGVPMALVEMTVPYFDIGLYGLENIYYNPDCYGAQAGASSQIGGTAETAEGVVTILHVLIWATEVYYNGLEEADAGKGWLANEGGWNGFSVMDSTPGSAFINFWGFGSNTNYYLNYEYPLAYPGWGATCDQIPVSDGDVVSMRYNAYTGNDGLYYHFGKPYIVTKDVLQGNQVNLTLFACTEDYTGYTTGHEPVGEGKYVYVVSEIGGDVLAEGTTNAYGDVRLDTSKLAVGSYYVLSDTFDPAMAILNIVPNVHTHSYEEIVTAPTCTEGGYTTYTCSCGDSYVGAYTSALGHDVVDGTCTRCGLSQTVIPEGAPFLSMVTDKGETVTITDMGMDPMYDMGTLYKVEVPLGTERVDVTYNEADVYVDQFGYAMTFMMGFDHVSNDGYPQSTKDGKTTVGLSMVKAAANGSPKPVELLNVPYPEDPYELHYVGLMNDDQSQYHFFVFTYKLEEGQYFVSLPAGVGYTVTGEPVASNGYTFNVSIAEGYEATEDFAVLVNGEVVATEPGDITVESVTADLHIEVDGVVKIVNPETDISVTIDLSGYEGVIEGNISYMNMSYESVDVELKAGKKNSLAMTATDNAGFFAQIYTISPLVLGYDVNGTVYPIPSNYTGYDLGNGFRLNLNNDGYMSLQTNSTNPGVFVVKPIVATPNSVGAAPAFNEDHIRVNDISIIGADVDSYAWDGDTLNVVLAEGTALDAPLKTMWNIFVHNTNEGAGNAMFNINGRLQTPSPKATFDWANGIVLADGAATMTVAFEVADTPWDPNSALQFTNKTFTVNFTIAAPHEHSYEAVVTAPTCTEGGYTTYTCECGDSYIADETAALGHTEEVIPAVAPTCTETGLTEGKKCSVCGEITVAQEVVDALGHTEEIIPAVAATCYGEGLTEGKKCSVCGEILVVQEAVPANGHTMTTTVVAPEHEKMGYTFHECANCDYSFVSDWTEALGHEYEKTVTREATCTEDGEWTFTCSCGKSYTQVMPKNGHSCDAVVTDPTCTEIGYTTHTCANCDFSYITDIVAALGHNGSEAVIENEIAATCTKDGSYDSVVYCSVCNEELTRETVTVPSVGHTEEILPAVAATCTEDGLTEGKKCSICNEILIEQEVIPATGHTWKGTGCENCDAKRENPFTDVPEDSWFIDSVLWAAEEGITEGATETTFNPTGDLLRAQVVTMLWRHAGSPVVDIANPFTDVKEGAYYYDAVLWAYSEGITAGTSATTFDPTGKTTRAQAITFLWRYLDEPEADTENPFNDVDTNKWYGKAVAWAVANGVTEGMSENQFGVSINCNRAHMVTFLYRALA